MKEYLVIYTIKDKKLYEKHLMLWKEGLNLEINNVFHLEDSMVMYGIYNAETIEKLVNTLEKSTMWNEKILAGKPTHWFNWYLSEQ